MKVEIIRKKLEIPLLRKKQITDPTYIYIDKQNDEYLRVVKYPNQNNTIHRIEEYEITLENMAEWYENGNLKSYKGNAINEDTYMTIELFENGNVKYIYIHTDGELDKKGNVVNSLILRAKKDSDEKYISLATNRSKHTSYEILYTDRTHFQIIRRRGTVVINGKEKSAFKHKYQWYTVVTYLDSALLSKKENIMFCETEMKKADKYIEIYKKFAIERSNKIKNTYNDLIQKGVKEKHKNITSAEKVVVPSKKYKWCYDHLKNNVISDKNAKN